MSQSVLWLKVQQEALGLNFILGAVYLPHEGSAFCDDDIFDDLGNDIVNINAKYDLPIILAGDFNARTGSIDDFVDVEDKVFTECDIDLISNEDLNTRGDLNNQGICTVRSNADRNVNNNGLNLIEICRSFNLKIMNGRFGGDEGVGVLLASLPTVKVQ